MPEYLSPGVYVEEIDAGPKPIEGVSTSTAGAVGVTARGPDTGKPILVNSFAEYMRVFGGPVIADEPTKAKWSDDPQKGEFWTFPLAIKGFFDNGGQHVYVRRVVSAGAQPAKAALGQGLATVITADAPQNSNVVQVASLLGIDTATSVQLLVGGVLLAANAVTAYDPAARTITLSNPIPQRVQRGDFVQIVTATGPSVSLRAKSVGVWGNYLSIQASPMDAGAFALLADPTGTFHGNSNKAVSTTITKDVIAAKPDDTFEVVSSADFWANDRITVGGKPFTAKVAAANKITVDLGVLKRDWKKGAVVAKAAAPNVTTTIKADSPATDNFDVDDFVTLGVGAGDGVLVDGQLYKVSAAASPNLKLVNALSWAKNTSVVRVRYAATVSATSDLYVWGASSLYEGAMVEVEDGAAKRKYYGLIATITGSDVKVTLNWPAAPGAPFDVWEGAKVRLIEASFNIRYEPPVGQAVDETIANVRLSGPDTDLLHIKNRLGAVSNLVDLVQPQTIDVTSFGSYPLAVDDPTVATPTVRAWTDLANGDDDFGSLDPNDFVGQDLGPSKRTGIQALEDIDDISICVVPSIWSSLVQNALIHHCETLKYRFAILDPPPINPNSIDAVGDIQRIPPGLRHRSTRRSTTRGSRSAIRSARRPSASAPSGHMAGSYARVDVERGVHKAPANEVIAGHRHRERLPRPRGRDHQARAGPAQPEGHQRAALLPRPRHPRVGRAHAVVATARGSTSTSAGSSSTSSSRSTSARSGWCSSRTTSDVGARAPDASRTS